MGHDDRQLRLDPDVRMLIDTTFVVLDLETTGLRAEQDRITEVGAVTVRGGDRLGELQTLVHPERPVPPAITAVTGITDAMLAGAPRIGEVLPTLLEVLRGSVLVAHNARFDVGFLDAHLTRLGYPRLANDVVDTARLARRLVRDEVRDLRLATLARFFRSPVLPTHRALVDARATVDVLHGLLERAGAIGATTTEDLLDLQRSRSMHSFRKVGLAAGAPRSPGVYRFHDREDRVLYVGTASDVRRRLRSYFGNDDRRRMEAMVRESRRVSWTVTPTSIEAAVREQRELTVRRPRFNRAGTRPPRCVWLRWTDERFPRLSITRSPGPDPTRSLGPLPGRRSGTALVEAVEEVVDVRRCTFRIRVAQDHPSCILADMGRCGAPCDGRVDAAGYAAQVVAAAALVAGDPAPLLAALRARMAQLADAHRFEDAGRVRGRMHAVARTLDGVRRTSALAAAGTLSLVKVGSAHVDAVRIGDGVLMASARVPTSAGAAAVAEALAATPDDPPDGERGAAAVRAERMLLARWLGSGDVRLVAGDGALAEQLAGGAAVAAAVAEARTVDRAARRDGQVLAGSKVRRRATAGPPATVAGARAAR